MYEMTVGDIQLLSTIILEEMDRDNGQGKAAETMEDALIHGEV